LELKFDSVADLWENNFRKSSNWSANFPKTKPVVVIFGEKKEQLLYLLTKQSLLVDEKKESQEKYSLYNIHLFELDAAIYLDYQMNKNPNNKQKRPWTTEEYLLLKTSDQFFMELLSKLGDVFILAIGTPTLVDQEFVTELQKNLPSNKTIMFVHFFQDSIEKQSLFERNKKFFPAGYNSFAVVKETESQDCASFSSFKSAFSIIAFRIFIGEILSTFWKDFRSNEVLEYPDKLNYVFSKPSKWENPFPVRWSSVFCHKSTGIELSTTLPEVAILDSPKGWMIELPNFSYNYEYLTSIFVISGERIHPKTKGKQNFIYAFQVPEDYQNEKLKIEKIDGILYVKFDSENVD